MIGYAIGSDDQDQSEEMDRGELTLTHSVYGLSDFLTKTSGEPQVNLKSTSRSTSSPPTRQTYL
jgi:hypothetical protein